MQRRKRIPFKVDVAGVIEIMGASLYSRPDTAVRELLQNAHDAVIRRRREDLKYRGRIDVVQDPENHTLTIHDDGVGLTPEQAEEYLGTLGIGITGILKADASACGESRDLIGQFGIGLFSAFMLADRLTVESRKAGCPHAVRWEAGSGTDIDISISQRETSGTSVTLYLKQDHLILAEREDLVQSILKRYADYLPVPIFLNDAKSRENLIDAAWFQPTVDNESLELALESYFDETPLDVIPVRMERPAMISGALYVTPRRTPGFVGNAVVAVTVRRMVISQQIQGLLPVWAPFLRGVLELSDCQPTASREDLVRNDALERVQRALERHLYEHFEGLAAKDRARLDSIIAWHRYSLAGAALDERRLRDLLVGTYRWMTSKGQLTFDEIIEQSPADALFDTDVDFVVWYNADRRQERWVNELFADHDVPCVHTLRNFEESLLGAMVRDRSERSAIDLRIASPSVPSFATGILGLRDLQDAPSQWQEFLAAGEVKVLTAEFATGQPAIAFLNERYELSKTFGELKKEGEIPAGFMRMIDAHFADASNGQNQVVLNRSHRLVHRALSQGTGSPLASVLRLLVSGALSAAGASVCRQAQRRQVEDLDWIAEALWGKGD